MAEPSKLNAKKFVQIFSVEYNKVNGTNFVWDDNRSYVAAEGKAYDVKLFDGKEELELQLTLSVGDAEKELVRPKKEQKVIMSLQKALEDDPNLPSLFVYISFHTIPKTAEEIRQAVFYLNLLITEKVENLDGPAFIDYDSQIDDQYMPKITKFISRLLVKPVTEADGERSFHFLFGSSADATKPLKDEVERIMDTIKLKEIKSKDTILLVSAGMYPLRNWSIEEIKKRMGTKDMKEVWLVEDFSSPGSRAIRLK